MPSPAPFRHVVHHLSDPEQFGLALSGVSLSANFLSQQSKPTIVEQFQTPDWALDFQEAHVRARIFAPLPEGWATLGFLRGPAQSSWYGAEARHGTLLCNPPGAPIDGWITPGFSCLAVIVPGSVWERCRQIAGADDRTLERFTAFQLPEHLHTPIERRLEDTRRMLRIAADHPHLAPQATERASDLACELVTLAWELSTAAPSRQDSPHNRFRLARQAETWMHDHLSQEFQIPDICLALGVSRRELEYAFRTVFDKSPRDFLQALRLNAIHRTLLHDGGPVTRIALDHGITHLGRFSASYRSLFGELPSATARFQDGRSPTRI